MSGVPDAGRLSTSFPAACRCRTCLSMQSGAVCGVEKAAVIEWDELLGLIVLIALAVFWYTGFRVREVALAAATDCCEDEAMQLLDSTVSLGCLRLARRHDGRLCVHRIYAFEYSDTGDNRHAGRVELMGDEVTLIHMQPRIRPATTFH
jgi:hypothetical protein